MTRLKKRMSRKKGLAPGELVHIGYVSDVKTEMYQFGFDVNALEEKQYSAVSEISLDCPKGHINWLNINGLADVKLIEALGKKFNIHHLILEDIVNTAQRPKMDDFSDCLYVVVKMVGCEGSGLQITEEQVSLLLLDNWVITFQEHPGDVFDPVRSRIRNSRGKIRSSDSSYLFYALLDCIVDNYFHVLEVVEERIDVLDNEVGVSADKQTLSHIHGVKSEVNFLKRASWPLRELLSDLLRNDAGLLNPEIMPYLRDINDHVKQILDAVADSRESVSGLFDLYASTMGNKMNQVMTVLTIMSAVFIPMTFIAGLYGMNFENIPELRCQNGYFYALSAMFAVAVGMLVIFKKKKWW